MHAAKLLYHHGKSISPTCTTTLCPRKTTLPAAAEQNSRQRSALGQFVNPREPTATTPSRLALAATTAINLCFLHFDILMAVTSKEGEWLSAKTWALFSAMESATGLAATFTTCATTRTTTRDLTRDSDKRYYANAAQLKSEIQKSRINGQNRRPAPTSSMTFSIGTSVRETLQAPLPDDAQALLRLRNAPLQPARLALQALGITRRA